MHPNGTNSIALDASRKQRQHEYRGVRSGHKKCDVTGNHVKHRVNDTVATHTLLGKVKIMSAINIINTNTRSVPVGKEQRTDYRWNTWMSYKFGNVTLWATTQTLTKVETGTEQLLRMIVTQGRSLLLFHARLHFLMEGMFQQVRINNRDTLF
jgi:hypothetical protein